MLLSAKVSAFVRFCRPHTIIATSLQVTGLFILAGGLQQRGLRDLVLLASALVSCLATNIYIVGLNQLADVEIDRVNKPTLPLASGEFSIRQGKWIVALSGIVAISLAVSRGPFLLMTVGISLVIGTIYSLPPLHLKGRPVWAALSIAFVRGIVANFGLFLHFHWALQPATPIPWLLVTALALFFFGYGLVIALYKDIPDLSGDKKFGIRTFTVRLGPDRVFKGGRLILTAFYLIPIVAAVALLPSLDGLLLLVPHLLITAIFWTVSWNVDPTEPAAVTRFYMFLWSLFYAEYILLSLNAITRAGTSGLV